MNLKSKGCGSRADSGSFGWFYGSMNAGIVVVQMAHNFGPSADANDERTYRHV